MLTDTESSPFLSPIITICYHLRENSPLVSTRSNSKLFCFLPELCQALLDFTKFLLRVFPFTQRESLFGKLYGLVVAHMLISVLIFCNHVCLNLLVISYINALEYYYRIDFVFYHLIEMDYLSAYWNLIGQSMLSLDLS